MSDPTTRGSAATDPVAPCPRCGFYTDTPNHYYGCPDRKELGGNAAAATYEGAGERKTPVPDQPGCPR